MLQALENTRCAPSAIRAGGRLHADGNEVDPEDPAFANPTKPIATYTETEVAALREELGWEMRRIRARMALRRAPRRCCAIVETALIGTAAARARWSSPAAAAAFRGARRNGLRHGVVAVIDKDRTSALMANLGIEDLIDPHVGAARRHRLRVDPTAPSSG